MGTLRQDDHRPLPDASHGLRYYISEIPLPKNTPMAHRVASIVVGKSSRLLAIDAFSMAPLFHLFRRKLPHHTDRCTAMPAFISSWAWLDFAPMKHRA